MALMLLLYAAGCSHVSQPHVSLHRALPVPLIALDTGGQVQATSVTLHGDPIRHSDVLFEDTPGFELVLRDAATGDTFKLRYALPGARRIPIPAAGEVRILLEGPALTTSPGAASDATYLGLSAFDAEGNLLALINESEAISEEAWSPWIRLRPTRVTTYRETVQWSGACLVVRDHESMEVQGSADESAHVLEPGMSATLETPSGPFDLTLLDHSRTTRTTCSNPPANRISFMLLRL
jgi:hypothetical protein